SNVVASAQNYAQGLLKPATELDSLQNLTPVQPRQLHIEQKDRRNRWRTTLESFFDQRKIMQRLLPVGDPDKRISHTRLLKHALDEFRIVVGIFDQQDFFHATTRPHTGCCCSMEATIL